MRLQFYRYSASVLLILLLAGGAAATPWVGPAATGGSGSPQAQAQAQAEDLPSAAEVIARYVEAIGGVDAIKGHTSSHASGTMELLGQGIRGDVDIYTAAPDKSLLIVNFAALGIESRTGYDGKVAWSTDPLTGERLLQAGERQQLIDDAEFYSDLHSPERFESMETVELTEFAGRPAYKLKLVHLSGREVFEYFDAENGRLVGTEGTQHSLMGTIEVRASASDYQQFEDIWLPTRLLQEIGPGQSAQIMIVSVEYDSVDPSVFALPASIEALIR